MSHSMFHRLSNDNDDHDDHDDHEDHEDDADHDDHDYLCFLNVPKHVSPLVKQQLKKKNPPQKI